MLWVRAGAVHEVSPRLPQLFDEFAPNWLRFRSRDQVDHFTRIILQIVEFPAIYLAVKADQLVARGA